VHGYADHCRVFSEADLRRRWGGEPGFRVVKIPGAFPSVEEAETYPYTEQELAIVHHARRRTIAGAPEQVRDRLLALACAYGAVELMIVAITFDFKARLRSYQLLAEAFGLDSSAEPRGADRTGGE